MILRKIINYNFLDMVETSEFIYFETADRREPNLNSSEFAMTYSFRFTIIRKFSPGDIRYAINTFKLKFI